MSWTLVVKAPDRVRELLLRYLELARFQHGDGDITRAELSRLAAAAPAQARSLLETEGYFEPKIGISLATEDPPTVVLEVEPGPRATIAALSLKVEGDLQT
ncbi:MAG TPA: POTRA domain-containing protein, partial [Methylibium sp.]